MDSGDRSFDTKDSWARISHLPVVIPPAHSPVAVPVWRRLVFPHWRLILVATFASGFGIASATLWPFQTKLGVIGHSPERDAERYATVAPAGDSPPDPSITTAPPAVHNVAHPSTTITTAPPAVDSAAHPSTTIAIAPPAGDDAARLSTTIRASTVPIGIDGDVCHAGFPSPQLLVSGPPTLLPAESPASLGLTVDGAVDGAQLVICGFASKSLFSAGRSIDEKTWTMPASAVADATLLPPRGFVGPMKLVVVLANPDNSLADRRALHLQWLPRTSSTSAVPRIAELNEHLEEGKRLKAAGNLPLARGIFLRYAQAGDSRAAFLLAETYDPISLAKRQLLPPESDPELARIWYRKASDWGSPDAGARLDRLSNW